jgi:hypothetical protein
LPKLLILRTRTFLPSSSDINGDAQIHTRRCAIRPFPPTPLSHRVLLWTIQIKGRLPVNIVIYITIYWISRLVHFSGAGRAGK